MKFIHFLGGKIDISYLVGVSPLLSHTGMSDGLGWCEITFDLYFSAYPYKVTTGKISQLEESMDKEAAREKINRIKSVHSRVFEVLDYLSEGKDIPERLLQPIDPVAAHTQ